MAGNIGPLLQGAAFIIVAGGTVGVVMVQTPLPTFLKAMKMTAWVFLPPVNEGKYRVLFDSMVAAFRSPTKSLMPIQIGNIAKVPASSAVELPPMATNRIVPKTQRGHTGSGQNAGTGKGDGDAAHAALHQVANDLARAFASLIDKDLVTVREGRLWLEVEIRAAVLFDSGSAEVKRDALPVVDQVVDILAGMPNSVRVEGYTDNVPISSGQYRARRRHPARAGTDPHARRAARHRFSFAARDAKRAVDRVRHAGGARAGRTGGDCGAARVAQRPPLAGRAPRRGRRAGLRAGTGTATRRPPAMT